MNLKKFKRLNLGISYYQYRIAKYLENKDLSDSTIKLRLVMIGNELRAKRKLLNDYGTKAMADELTMRGFKCYNQQVIAVEYGRAYSKDLLVKYIEVLKDLLQSQGKEPLNLNKIF